MLVYKCACVKGSFAEIQGSFAKIQCYSVDTQGSSSISRMCIHTYVNEYTYYIYMHVSGDARVAPNVPQPVLYVYACIHM